MARMARVVVPGVPHHVTQRGNRRQATFFREGDYQTYKLLVAQWCQSEGVEVWAYCLMPNHVHLIVVPSTERSLRAAISEIHRRYTVMVNTRKGWRGCLWQGRFFSFPMAPGHLFNGARYVELNPVRSGLVDRAEDWPHSSARAHLAGCSDGIVEPQALLERLGDWRALLSLDASQDSIEEIRRHVRTGRPFGDEGFLDRLETTTGRRLRPLKRGRKPRESTAPCVAPRHLEPPSRPPDRQRESPSVQCR
jgi:putative transposase